MLLEELLDVCLADRRGDIAEEEALDSMGKNAIPFTTMDIE